MASAAPRERHHRGTRIAVFVCAALLVCACAGFARWTRRHTYPPDFQYVTQDELRSAMWRLAWHSAALDAALRASAGHDSRRTEVLRALRGMEEAAGALAQEGWRSNHPLIDANLDGFRRDIARARQAAERVPPDYTDAGRVSGACVYCHGGDIASR
jgi:hypothetical protein